MFANETSDQGHHQVTNAVPINSPSTATTGSTILGMDTSTVIISIVVPIILTILGVILKIWLPRKMRDKLRVRVVSKLSGQQFQQLSALYCDRVPDYERVPPNHFRAFLQREHSARSLRDFRHRTRRATAPAHLLLVARTSEGICGFVKAIFIPDLRCLFIAYLVTAPGGNYEGRTVAQKLISSLFAACQDSTIHSIVYEICAEPMSKHKAKARLFRHHGSALGIKLRRIAAKYQQPEICSFEAGDCKVTNAELYITHVGNQAQDAWHSMTRAEYQNLVSAIYKSVYLLSYAVAEPQFVEKYRDFLHRVTKSLFASIKNQTIDLK